MLVMLANNTGIDVGYLAGKFPGSIGHLYSPGAQRPPRKWLPYALDNGAYGAFANGKEWDAGAWRDLLAWARLSGQDPLWSLVPDVVGDRIRTLRRWDIYAPIAAEYGWPLAFAVQDGMTASDVPSGTDVVFVGGTTEWKWATAGMWAREFSRVHIGRVNEYRRLVQCEAWGVESTDGTGWTREPGGRQWRGLCAYLEESFGLRERPKQEKLCYDEMR